MTNYSSYFLLLALITVVVHAQVENVANRAKAANTVIEYGLKILKQKQIADLMSCVDPMIYDLKPYNETKEKGKSCAMDSCNTDRLGCYSALLNANNKIDACLKQSGSKNTAMDLVDKALDIAAPTLKKYLTEIQNKVKTDKKNKVSKKNVYENAYKMAVNKVTVKLVNDVGMKIAKPMIPKEYGCVIKNVGTLVDVNAKDYKFTKLPQS